MTVKFNIFSFNVNLTVKLNVKWLVRLTVKSRTLRTRAAVGRGSRPGLRPAHLVVVVGHDARQLASRLPPGLLASLTLLALTLLAFERS